MSAPWTPGPWRTGPINYADIYGANGELITLIPKGYPHTVANAHLISAAPELFEALETLVDCLVGTTRHDLPGYVGSQEEADKIYAALAKARGEVA